MNRHEDFYSLRSIALKSTPSVRQVFMKVRSTRVTQIAVLRPSKTRNGFKFGRYDRFVVRGEKEEGSERFVIGRVARRTLLVSFKCNLCEARTDRLVNPHAWNKGTVFVQCKSCEIWHQLKDNLNLIDEIRYNEEE